MAVKIDYLLKEWQGKPVGTRVQLEESLWKDMVTQGYFADPSDPQKLEAKKKPLKTVDADKQNGK